MAARQSAALARDTSDRGSPKTIEAFCVDLLSEIIDQSVIQSEQDAYWKNL